MKIDNEEMKVLDTCWQHKIRLRQGSSTQRIISSLDGCIVGRCSSDVAAKIIEQYEWLGTVGRPQATYALYAPPAPNGGLWPTCEVLGVATFGLPSSPESRNICGAEFARYAICLERGACVPHAPPNSASFLISHACNLAHLEHKWTIFYAYADESAGEIGAVYQAASWLYLGCGIGRTEGRKREKFKLPDGRILSDRSLRHKKITKLQAIELGWSVLRHPPKHKYVTFRGSSRTKCRLKRRLRYETKPYPKRGRI